MGRAGPMGQLIMDFTGPVLGWAWSTWARAGLGRELVSPWRTLLTGNRRLVEHRDNNYSLELLFSL